MIILGTEGRKPLRGNRHLAQQQGKVLAFIAGGFLAVEHSIEVVAQFLAQHSDALLLARLLQPIRIEVDRARGAAIGTRRGGHRAAAEQSDGGES